MSNWGIVPLKTKKDRCICLAYSSVPDVFCKYCNGTGKIEEHHKDFPKKEEIDKDVWTYYIRRDTGS